MAYPNINPAWVWRDYNTIGVPGSGAHEPEKYEIRRLFADIQDTILTIIAGGGGDIELTRGVIYYDVVGGTPNDILAEPDAELPEDRSTVIYILSGIAAPNTGDVTVNSVPLLTNSGSQIAPDGLVAGGMYLFLSNPDGTQYRLVSDQASAAIQAAAEAAQEAAEQAAGSVLFPVSYGIEQNLTAGQRLQARMNIGIGKDIKTPEMFGAVGDGVADDTTSVQTWLNQGGTLDVTPGAVYRCLSTITLPVGSTINAYGATFLLRDTTGGAPPSVGIGVDTPNGAYANTLTVIGDVPLGSRTIPVSPGDEASYAEGDAIQLYNLSQRYDSVHPYKGEVHFVKSVSSGQIELTEAVWDTYLGTSESIRVRKVIYNPGTKIFGGTWRGLGSAATQSRLIRFRFMKDCGIYDANIEDGWTVGVTFYNCLHYFAMRNNVRRIMSDTQGYGIFSELSSQWGSVSDNVFQNVGVSVDIGGTTSEPGAVRFLTITNNKAYDIIRGCLSLHSNGCDILVDGNYLEASDAHLLTQSGLYVRAANVTITNNTIYFGSGPGLLYAAIMIENRNAVSDVIIAHNKIVNARQSCIAIVQSIDSGVNIAARVRSVIIEGNIMDDAEKDGIIVRTSSNADSVGMDDAIISNNKFRNRNTIGSSGILINPLGAPLKRVTVSGNHSENPNSDAGYGVRFTIPTGASVGSILVMGNHVEGDIGVGFNAGALVGTGKIIGNVISAGTPISNVPGTVTVT